MQQYACIYVHGFMLRAYWGHICMYTHMGLRGRIGLHRDIRFYETSTCLFDLAKHRRPCEKARALSRLTLRIATGRRHQLRSHLTMASWFRV